MRRKTPKKLFHSRYRSPGSGSSVFVFLTMYRLRVAYHIFSFLSLNILGISPLSILMINYFIISWEERIGAMDTWNLSLYLHIQPD